MPIDLKRLTRRNIYDLIHRTRVHRVIPERNYYSGAILSLHRVIGDSCDYNLRQIRRLHVSRTFLEGLISYYQGSGYEIISLDEVYEILRRGDSKRKFVAFTFDDGYVDNYEIAYPLFEKYGVPFAIYVATAIPDGTFVNWPFMLDDLVYKNDSLNFLVKGRAWRCDTSSSAKKEKVFSAIEDVINNSPIEDRNALLGEIFTPYGYDFHEHSRKTGLSWAQIEEMSRSGFVTIGAHTVNHLEIAKLSPEEAEAEILGGKEVLESHIEKKVEHFAFPFGCIPAVGRREFEIARKCSFKTCATTMHGYLSSRDTTRLERLPRIHVDEATKMGSIDISFNSRIDRLFRLNP